MMKLWQKYAATYSEGANKALNAMRRVSRLHRTIVKRALQRQKEQGK